MLVVIEGPDGSGKSTLVRKLRDFDLARQFWCLSSARRYHSLTEVADFINWIQARPLSAARLVFDRFPIISEWVYGPIIRKSYFDRHLSLQCPPVVADIEKIAEVIRRLDPEPLIVQCCPLFHVLQERVHGEPQMDGVIEHLREIYDRYELLMEHLGRHILVYKIDPFEDIHLRKFEEFLSIFTRRTT